MSELTSSETERQDSTLTILPIFDQKESLEAITRISVRGYKSLYEECSIEICPLTILAGANSSGKSSIMQPLLLLKQTLEATYDPGPLLIFGPNIKFSLAAQLLSFLSAEKCTDRFTIKVDTNVYGAFQNTFKNQTDRGIELIETIYITAKSEPVKIINTLNYEEFVSGIPQWMKNNNLVKREGASDTRKWMARRNRCFFDLELASSMKYNFSEGFQKLIRKLIHVSGFRGNPERTYHTTAVGSEFPGTFENYVASIINYWQKTEDYRLIDLGKALEKLGLTWKVDAKQVNDVQIELRVGRLPRNGSKEDMVSLADVGSGVSQTLPVLVALLVAEPGQLVYLEQPEIHLHPRAQATLAEILADAANRGVRVVVETHSDLLLRRIQSLVAEGEIPPKNVKLHWFKRRDDGVTEISSAELDDAGAFGEWPEDFSDIALEEESRYLDAAESRLARR